MTMVQYALRFPNPRGNPAYTLTWWYAEVTVSELFRDLADLTARGYEGPIRIRNGMETQ